MSDNYARPLTTDLLVENFLLEVLEVNNEPGLENYISQISSAQIQLPTHKAFSTLKDGSFRFAEYRSDTQRKNLYIRILKELINIPRLDNDDDIKLGVGGAKPSGEVSFDKKAYIIIGLPASGKSGIANKIADETNSLIIDSDFVKRKLPEFWSENGAAKVHEESSALTMGGGLPKGIFSLFHVCLAEKMNMVIPKIGHDLESMKKLCDTLKENGYEIHLILVSLDRQKATKRAFYRFCKTNRYVPLAMIFDGYANDPTLTYYKLKSDYKKIKSFAMISTDVDINQPPYLIELTSHSPAKIYQV